MSPAAPAAPMAPMVQPEYQAPPPPAIQPSQCPTGCLKRCFTYCPEACCGMGKRDEVTKNVGSGNEEDTADQVESEQKDEGSGNENADKEETEQSQVEQQSTENNEKAEDNSEKTEEQTTNDTSQEGSSESSDNVENDD